MGWSRLQITEEDPLLDGLEDDAWAYFVHGFVCPDGPATLARTDYGGVVPAVVRQANRWGCQFHPERSAGRRPHPEELSGTAPSEHDRLSGHRPAERRLRAADARQVRPGDPL
jgi:GMP synthase-like glutamine amidotransferase